MKIIKNETGLRVSPKFVWGKVIKIHEITPDIHVVEHVHKNVEGKERGIMFHPFVGMKDISRDCHSLEEAIITAIAITYEGHNTQADYYFCRMIGIHKE